MMILRRLSFLLTLIVLLFLMALEALSSMVVGTLQALMFVML